MTDRDDGARVARGAWPAEIRATVALALPIVAAQVGWQLMGLVDTVMIGRYSGEAMAAVGVGHQLVSLLTFFGMGTLVGLDPILGQALGAGDETGFRRAAQRGVVLAVALTVPLTLVGLQTGPLLRALDQPEALVPDVVAYVDLLLPGILPILLFGLQRQVLQCLHRTRAIVAMTVIANAWNIAANAVLIHGCELPFDFAVPALGVRGSALATLTSRVLLAVGLAWAAWPNLGPRLLPFDRACLRPGPLGRALRLGAPIGTQFLVEVGAFHAAILTMGWIGVAAVGAHQIALQLAALSYMVPLGISAAAAVRVAHGVGARDLAAAKRSAVVVVALAVALGCCFTVAFLVGAGPLARAFTEDTAILAIAAGSLIPIAGAFQIFDGLQVVLIGVLRGLGDTRSPLWANIAGFWLLGLPLGIPLGLRTDLGPAGVWLGLVIGLGFTAAALSFRVLRVFDRPVRRLVLDVEHAEPRLLERDDAPPPKPTEPGLPPPAQALESPEESEPGT